MARNVLADIDVLFVEIVDVGFKKIGTDIKVPYKEETKRVFSKLLSYIRGGSWIDNETAKFVAQNFMLGQSNLADAWHSRYPSKPEKADSTMRTQWQKVNNYLSNVLPNDIVDIFVTENMERINDIDVIIDTLHFNDQRVESILGEQLVYELQCLQIPSKKYSVSDCSHEIEVMKRLSSKTYQELLATCDKSKLAYAFHSMTRPSSTKGDINRIRLEFIKAFAECTEEVKSNDIFPTLRGYIGDTEPLEDSVVNPDILYDLHSYFTSDGILSNFSKYDKKDLAYILRELDNGNEVFLEALRNGRPNSDKSSLKYRLLEGVQGLVEDMIEDVEPSSKISPVAVQVLSDYILDSVKNRLGSLKPEELARVYKDMIDSDSTKTDALIEKFISKGVSEYENERLALKKDYVSE